MEPHVAELSTHGDDGALAEDAAERARLAGSWGWRSSCSLPAQAPGHVRFWGGGVDVFIGATALTVAYLVLAIRPVPRRLFVAWNLFGIFDFVVAWPIIFLFSATAAGVLAGSGPTTEAFLKFPMSFIPMFGVPFTCCLHLIALMQVRGGREPRVSPLFLRPSSGA